MRGLSTAEIDHGRTNSKAPAGGTGVIPSSSSSTSAQPRDDAEPTSSHHAHSLNPPLLLPPPAFATVAPDIYRCSSSFPTPQDIAFASVQGRNSNAHPPSSAVQTNPPSSAAAAKDVPARASTKPPPSSVVVDSSKSAAANPPSSHVLLSSSSSSSSSSASPVPSLMDRSQPSSTRSVPDRDSAISGLKTSGSAASSSQPSPSASSLPTPSRNSPAPPHGQGQARSRVNSASSLARHHHHHHTSALSGAAAMYTPFLDQLQLRTVLVLGWERPSKTLERYCRARNIRIVHLALDGSRIGPARKGRQQQQQQQQQHPSTAVSASSQRAGSRTSSSSPPPPPPAPAPPPLPQSGGGTAEAGATTTTTDGSNDTGDRNDDRLKPKLRSTQACSGPLSGINSLFAPSIHQSSLISERMVKDGLELILDKHSHPIIIMDTSGIQETGVLVGCLRRMQRWDFASIVVEYRSFAGARSRVVNERFIEMFDTDLTTLPPTDKLPPFFVEQLAMDEDELDHMYEC